MQRIAERGNGGCWPGQVIVAFLIGAALTACAASAADDSEVESLSSSLASPSGSASDRDDLADEPGAHGADEAWVHCPKRKHIWATDPLGPVVAHGVREAPGYRPGLVHPNQARFLRRASLHLGRGVNGFLYEKVTLPSPHPRDEEVGSAVEAAVLLAGLEPPGEVKVTAQRELEHGEKSGFVERRWDVAFVHEGVRIAPARCSLSVQQGQTFPATLDCMLPAGGSLLRFDRFALSDDEVLGIATELTRVAPFQHSVSRIYHAVGARAEARYQIVSYDGEQEVLTVVDGAGNALAAGLNDRPFRFDGYDLDYVPGFQQGLESPIDAAWGQSVLDSVQPLPGYVSCLRFMLEGTQKPFAAGFAVCENAILKSDGWDTLSGEYLQQLVAPRFDDDFTNAPGKGDPLGRQILFFSPEVNGSPLVHTDRSDITAWPWGSTPWEIYVRKDTPAEQPINPGHHAELQLFYDVGKLAMFYRIFDSRFLKGGTQDRFRTELKVHWNRQEQDPDETKIFNFGGRAGRFFIGMGDFAPHDLKPFEPDVNSYLRLDGTTDGSIVAHEYHHHIQESLALDEGWIVEPNNNPQELLFPWPQKSSCPEGADCNRRENILEGVADGFGALLVGRGVLGTLTASWEPLPSLLAACDNNTAYGDGFVAPPAPVRALCSYTTFGYWEEAAGSVCAGDSTNKFGARRPLVIGGALYGYQTPFLRAGYGPAVPGRHMLEAERVLTDLDMGEPVYQHGLVTYLRGLGPVDLKRYEYTARAAFIEKGVFPLEVHLAPAKGNTADSKPDVTCNAEAGCSAQDALDLSALTLTMSGPFNWGGDPTDTTDAGPEFDLFAPPGDQYAKIYFGKTGNFYNVVQMQFADNPSFSAVGGNGVVETVNTAIYSDEAHRVNCAPPGFRRMRGGQAWRTVAQSALNKKKRVYFRVWQCLPGKYPPDPTQNYKKGPVPGCVVSTLPNVPAYVAVSALPPTCTCRVPGAPLDSNTRWVAIAGLFAAALGIARRGTRR